MLALLFAATTLLFLFETADADLNVASLRKQLESSADANTRTREELTAATALAATRLSENELLNVRLDSLRKNIEKSTAAEKQLAADIEALNKKNTEAAGVLAAEKLEADAARTDATKERERAAALDKELGEVRAQVDNLGKQLDAERARAGDAAAAEEKRATEVEITTKPAPAPVSTPASTLTEADLDKPPAGSGELGARLDRLQRRNAVLEIINEELTAKNKKLTEGNKDLTAENNRRKIEIETLKADIEKLRAEIKRLTTPPRKEAGTGDYRNV